MGVLYVPRRTWQNHVGRVTLRVWAETLAVVGLFFVVLALYALDLLPRIDTVGGPRAAVVAVQDQCRREMAERCLAIHWLAEVPGTKNSYRLVFYTADALTPNGQRVTTFYVVYLQGEQVVQVK